MHAPIVFSAPEPVAMAISTNLPRGEVIDRLSRAAGELRYSTRGSDTPRFWRFGGSVGAGGMFVTARPYIRPGLSGKTGAMPLEFRGQVIPAPGGSEIRGVLDAPIRSADVRFLALFLVALVTFGLVDNEGSWLIPLFVTTTAITMALIWTWMIRRLQRVTLSKSAEFERIVREVLENP